MAGPNDSASGDVDMDFARDDDALDSNSLFPLSPYGAFGIFSPEILAWIVLRIAEVNTGAVCLLSSTCRSWHELVSQVCAQRLRTLQLSRTRPILSLVPVGVSAPVALSAYAAIWPRTERRRSAMQARVVERQLATHGGVLPQHVAGVLSGLRFVENSVGLCHGVHAVGGGRIAFEIPLDGGSSASALVLSPAHRRRFPAVEFDCEVVTGVGYTTHSVSFGYCLPGDSERRCFGAFEGTEDPFERNGARSGQAHLEPVRCMPVHPVLWDIVADGWPSFSRADFISLLRDCYDAATDDLAVPFIAGAVNTGLRGGADDADDGDDGDDDNGNDDDAASDGVSFVDRAGVGPYECRRALDALNIPVFREFFDVLGAHYGLRLMRRAYAAVTCGGLLNGLQPRLLRSAHEGIERMGCPADAASALETSYGRRHYSRPFAAYFNDHQLRPTGAQPIGSSFGYGPITPDGYERTRPRPYFSRERLDAVRRGVLPSPFMGGANPFSLARRQSPRTRNRRPVWDNDNSGSDDDDNDDGDDGDYGDDGDDGDDGDMNEDLYSNPYPHRGYGDAPSRLSGHRLGSEPSAPVAAHRTSSVACNESCDGVSERARLDRERQSHAEARRKALTLEQRQREEASAAADVAAVAAAAAQQSLTARLHEERLRVAALRASRVSAPQQPTPVDPPVANGILSSLGELRRMQQQQQQQARGALVRRSGTAPAMDTGASSAVAPPSDALPLTALLAAERIGRRDAPIRRSPAPANTGTAQQTRPQPLQFGGAQRLGYMDDQ
eukprot:Opistho-2@46770